MTAEKLEQSGLTVTILDSNPRTISTPIGLGKKACHGDVTDPEALKAAGIEQCDALILAIPDEKVAVAACRIARQLQPNIFIAARTNFVSRGLLASQAGADAVVIEEVVTAQAMQELIMTALVGKK